MPQLQAWLNDPEVTEGLSHCVPFSMAEEEHWYDSMMKLEVEKRPLAIEIQDAKDWRFVGDVGLLNLEWTSRSAELGIFIGDKSRWDQGYGTEAVQVMLRHGFNTLNLHRIYLRVFATNTRARRSYEKAGFILEGTLRQAIFRHGTYVDLHVMSILRTEWQPASEGK